MSTNSQPACRPALPPNRIIDGKYSLRAYYFVRDKGVEQIAYKLTRKGSRSHWDEFASITPSSDGQCFIVSAAGRAIDARRTLDEAIALALAHAGSSQAAMYGLG